MKNQETGKTNIEEMEIHQAQKELLKKREAIKQSRINTLALVKNLLPKNLQSAIEKTKELEGSEEGLQAVELIMQQTKPEIKTCESCGDILAMKFDSQEFSWYFLKCRKCEEQREARQKQMAMNRAKQFVKDNITKIMLEHGVPKRFVNATLESWPKSYESILNDDRGLYLHGDRGVGKTYLVCALMRDIILRIEPVESAYTGYTIPERLIPFFITVTDLLIEIQDAFKDSSSVSQKQLLEKYSTIEILVLDDLGAEKMTEWVFQTLFAIFNSRYNGMKKTYITGNLSLKDLSNRTVPNVIGKPWDRIASRIAEMCQVKFMDGEDRRLKR